MRLLRRDTIRSSTWIVCVLAIASGFFFRIHDIDRKVYGVDETVTSLRVAGATLAEVRRDLRAGRLHSLAATRERYQLEQPHSNVGTTIASLARDDPQHPPLYFILQREWQGAGESIVAWRSLSVVFGLALVLAVFWLGTELLAVDAGVIAAALVAVSPFHVAYAQYNREYALWALIMVLSSALVLVALRRGHPVAWMAYGASVSLGLYTDPLFLALAVAHAAYVGVSLGLRQLDIRSARIFIAALLAGLISYAPWLVVMWRGRHVIQTTTDWYATPLPVKLLLAKWLFESASVFFDAEYGDLRLGLLAAIVVTVAAAVALFGMNEIARGRAAFLFFLITASAVPLVVADLALHESRSTASRYLSPAWLGFELAVAAGIAALVRGDRLVARRAGVTLAALLVLAGGVCDAASSARTSWWVDSQDKSLVSVARALSAEPDADLCHIDNFENVLVLSDAVSTHITLSASYVPGCLAVATATEMRKIVPRSGVFVRRLPASREENSGVDALHEEAGNARRLPFESVELWQYRPTR